MVLTAENYYSQEANEEYMSVSQFKDFCGTYGKMPCEFTAMEKLKGRWEEPKSKALMVGSYVDSYFEGSFKHKVTSTVQITDKKDGNMDTEMELAFDEDSGEYVLQPVANTTQKSIFDSDYKENLKPENEEESEKEEPKGIPQLPGPSEVEDEDVIDAEYTETEIDQETDEEPEEDITDEILGDAEEPDDMDGYDYEDPEDEV